MESKSQQNQEDRFNSALNLNSGVSQEESLPVQAIKSQFDSSH